MSTIKVPDVTSVPQLLEHPVASLGAGAHGATRPEARTSSSCSRRGRLAWPTGIPIGKMFRYDMAVALELERHLGGAASGSRWRCPADRNPSAQRGRSGGSAWPERFIRRWRHGQRQGELKWRRAVASRRGAPFHDITENEARPTWRLLFPLPR